jgi:hypothetical protein
VAVVVLAVVAAVAVIWLTIDRQPQEWDPANHLERAVQCAHDIARGDVESLLERSSFYPPLVMCSAGLVYLMWPTDVMGARAVVLAFLGLGLAAVYSAHGPRCGSAACPRWSTWVLRASPARSRPRCARV